MVLFMAFLMTVIMRITTIWTTTSLVTAIRTAAITVTLMIVSLRPIARSLLSVTIRAAAAGIVLPDLLLTAIVTARAISP
jgi:hypothetical protein